MAASNFEKLASKLADRPGVTNPRGLAYAIGARKYGASNMARAAAKGVSAASVTKRK